jgi:hypothetical protein
MAKRIHAVNLIILLKVSAGSALIIKVYETWARRVKTPEDVPATFKGFFDSVTANAT